MGDGTQTAAKKTNITYIVIALTAIVLVLGVFNFQNIDSYQRMADDVQTQLLQSDLSENPTSSQPTEAVLLTYRNMHDLVEMKVNLKGVQGALAQYRASALKFICTNPSLVASLESDKTVILELVASRRKDDKYFELQVSKELCLGIS